MEFYIIPIRIFAKPLPLELLTFQPSIFSRAAIQLQWQTANEVGTDPMLLYRSRDGVEWEMIYATNSKGSRAGSYYTYLDENLTDGIYYYKLETNGKSWIRTVKLGSAVAPVTLYPNPTDGILHLSEPQSTLSLYNPIGQLIANYETTNEIDLSQLPKGIYYLELENGERKMVVKNKKLVYWQM
ncbi:MAG: T9SS type A sorting domain-containing protein [Saprospiraceae bacterium]|nr:T9SS type A sorting domain-containing protein [Saprospiraceae bacterium]